jgi:hypothetical protein
MYKVFRLVNHHIVAETVAMTVEQAEALQQEATGMATTTGQSDRVLLVEQEKNP